MESSPWGGIYEQNTSAMYLTRIMPSVKQKMQLGYSIVGYSPTRNERQRTADRTQFTDPSWRKWLHPHPRVAESSTTKSAIESTNHGHLPQFRLNRSTLSIFS